MGENVPGTKEHRANEKAAQERYNIPIAKAGRDHITRPGLNHEAMRDSWDRIWGKKNKEKKDD